MTIPEESSIDSTGTDVRPRNRTSPTRPSNISPRTPFRHPKNDITPAHSLEWCEAGQGAGLGEAFRRSFVAWFVTVRLESPDLRVRALANCTQPATAT